MPDLPAEEEKEDKDFLARFKENFKEENPQLPLTLGIILIVVFLIAASLAPQISQKLGQLSQKKQGQVSFAKEEEPPKPSETEFISNELLIKIKKEVKNKVKEGNAQDTGVTSLNKLNKEVQVNKFEKVAKVGKNSKADAEIFAWYKITLAGSGTILKERGDNTKSTPEELEKVEKIKSVLAKYKQDPNVEAVELNYIIRTMQVSTPTPQGESSPSASVSATTPEASLAPLSEQAIVPNDPYYSSSGSWGQPYDDLWGLKKINASAAWDQTTGSSSIIVADIDSGVDRNHEDIRDNMWVNTAETPNNGVDDDGNGYPDDYYGWDWVNNDNDPMDDFGHGTHTVGTIAATGNNCIGVVGVNCVSKIMALKPFGSTGRGSTANVVQALQYAADMGARVSSNSYTGLSSGTALEDAIDYAHDRGMVIVVAAGNSYADALDFMPAAADKVITVAASDHNDLKSDFSNWGEKIDVAAPGGDEQDGSTNATYRNILSLRAAGTDMYGDGKSIVGDYYYRARGTSMAAPHVAGLAALLLAKNTSL